MQSQFVRFSCGKGHFDGRVRVHHVYDDVPLTRPRIRKKQRKSRGYFWTRPKCPVCAIDREVQRLLNLRQKKKGPGFVRD